MSSDQNFSTIYSRDEAQKNKKPRPWLPWVLVAIVAIVAIIAMALA